MQHARDWAVRHPRVAASVAFTIAALVTAGALWRGSPAAGWRLIAAAGVTSAAAGAITGRRMLDPLRTTLHAGAIGGVTSLISLLLFSELLAVSIARGGGHSNGFALAILTPSFAFLAMGWIVAAVGAAVGSGMHKLLR